MAPGEATFRARAASLLHPFTSSKSSDQDPEKNDLGQPDLSEKLNVGELTSVDSNGHNTSGDDAVAHDRAAQRIVRSIPAWVKFPEDDQGNHDPTSYLFEYGLPAAQIARHNSLPAPKQKQKPERGRLYDKQRDWATPTPSVLTQGSASRWRAFADASAYPAISDNGGMLVDEAWLIQNGADYSRPWLAGSREDDEMNGIRFWQSKRKAWYLRAQRTILRNPVIPLVFRSIVFIFSAVALSLAGSIYHRTNADPTLSNTASTDLAIVVDTIALVYLVYITYDEYTGAPLGLRSARAKMRLIFLDLIFIVFNSANLSLAYEGIHGHGSVCVIGLSKKSLGDESRCSCPLLGILETSVQTPACQSPA
ncbi:MAG: hypothetical protein Q9191_006843 [Dirinaria sp. TL-2023a]